MRAQEGQTEIPTDQDASESDSNPVLFGGTTNLDSSLPSKGVTNGIAQSGAKKLKHRGEFAVAPIPLLNPSIGNGMGGILMYTWKLDSDNATPPSTIGLGGFGTGSGSWSLGLGARLYLKHDLYRVLVGVGGGTFNYNFFGIGPSAGSAGIAIPFSQRSRAFLIQPTRHIWGKWYVGPRYHYLNNQVKLNQDRYPDGKVMPLPIPLPDHLSLTTAALGLAILRDSSNNAFYPGSGSILNVTMDFFSPAFGAQLRYRNFQAEYNKYLSVGAKNVFAGHVSGCVVSDHTPFFDLCMLGLSKDLRGYPVGQYRDARMLDGQVEYRRELFWRLGAVAFVGLGEVGKTFGDFNGSNLVPGGGVGLRYRLTKQNHINLRADYAWGDNSRAFYMGVGEAF